MTEPDGATFQTRLKGPDLLRLGAVVVAVTAIVVLAATAIGASPGPLAGGASPGASAQASPLAKQGGRGPWRVFAGGPSAGFGFRDHGRGIMGGFGQITITAIDGSKLSLKTEDGWTRTVEVTSSTAITKGGQSIALGDLKVGDRIVFRQTRNADGSFSIAAIQVVVPRVAGGVTAVSNTGFTLKARDGTTWTVAVTGSTTFSVGSKAGARSDIKVGADVVVEGTQGAGNTLTALSVHVQLPRVVGQVTAKTAATLTIRRPNGTTATIHVGGATTYRLPGTTNGGLADIAVGAFIVVEGTQRTDGSIDASVVAAGKIRGRPDLPHPSPTAG